jgi:hypothetical protein
MRSTVKLPKAQRYTKNVNLLEEDENGDLVKYEDYRILHERLQRAVDHAGGKSWHARSRLFNILIGEEDE